MITLVADHDANAEIMLVRPDAHLGWRGPADPDALDRWLTAVARQLRAHLSPSNLGRDELAPALGYHVRRSGDPAGTAGAGTGAPAAAGVRTCSGRTPMPTRRAGTPCRTG
jgi:hypothetical protein